jgi:hypothetical protein
MDAVKNVKSLISDLYQNISKIVDDDLILDDIEQMLTEIEAIVEEYDE